MKKYDFLNIRCWMFLMALCLWTSSAFAQGGKITSSDSEIDCTSRISNYNFMTNGYFSTDGWTLSRRYEKGNLQQCPSASGCLEYWNSTAAQRNFDFYQELTDLENGKYVLRASMWYSGNNKACGVYASNAGSAEVFVGCNHEEVPANRVEYQTRSIIVYDGTLRVGAKNRDIMDANWFGLDYIKLIKVGEASSIEIEEAKANAKLTQKMQETVAKTEVSCNFGSYLSVFKEAYKGNTVNFEAGKDIIYYELSDLKPGTYRVNFYAVANCARNQETITTGDNIAQIFANNTARDISVVDQSGGASPEKENCAPTNYPRTLIAEVGSDGKLRYGIRNIAQGGQWYVTKPISLQKINTISDCLCFSSPGYAQITFANVNRNTVHDFEYSIDGVIWEDYICSTATANSKTAEGTVTADEKTTIDISHNQRAYFRAKGRTGMLSEGGDLKLIEDGHPDFSRYTFYQVQKLGKTVDDIYASGNVMSLIDPYCQMTEVPKTCFSRLFMGMNKLVTAPRLPATTLGQYCYEYMFFGCSSLVAGPTIPATHFEGGCMSYMFSSCTKLASLDVSFRDGAPGDNCFDVRTESNSTKCIVWCFSKNEEGMATGWTPDNKYSTKNVSLKYKDANGNADYLCVTNIGSGNATIKLKKADTYQIQYSQTGYDSWTNVDPATPIVLNNTNQARLFFRARPGKDNSTDGTFSASNYLQFEMTGRIAASGDIRSLLKSDCAVTVLPHHAFYHLFEGCTSLEQAPNLKFTALSESCYEGMFKNCTNLFASPELPAEVLVPSCYKEMFRGCSSLRMITSSFKLWDETGTKKTSIDEDTGEEIITFTPAQNNATWHWVEGVYRDTECRFMNDVIKDLIYDESHIPCDSTVRWYVGDEKYLTLTARDAASWVRLNPVGITWNWSGSYDESKSPFVKLDYRTKAANGRWSSWRKYTFRNQQDEDGTTQTEAKLIHLAKDEMVQFRAGSIMRVYAASTNTTYYYYYPEINRTFSQSASQYYQFEFQSDGGNIEATGNVFSLLSYNCANEAVPDYAFYQLFSNNEKLISVPDLPGTKLGTSCYQEMFYNCANLTHVTSLPAVELASSCYYKMFSGTGITEAPLLPATKLAANCYGFMFQSCTALATAPVLSADKVETSCYESMFEGCSTLEKAPRLRARTMATSCYKNMFSGCTMLDDAPVLVSKELANNCYEGLFRNCRSLISAPDLPASSLSTSCYRDMFNGCSSLKKISVQFTDWNNGAYTTGWVAGVPEKGNFVCPEDLPTGNTDFNENQVPKNEAHHWNVIKNPYIWFMAEDSNGSSVQLKKNGTIANIPLLEYSTTGIISDWHVCDFTQVIPLAEVGDIVMFRAKVNYIDCDRCSETPGEESNGDPCTKCKGQLTVVSSYETNNSFSKSTDDFFQFVTSGNLNLNGNVSSLINSQYHKNWTVPGFVEAVPDEGGYTFYGLFKGNKNITGKADLSFTTLKPHCYQSIFEDCEKLSMASDLPATATQDYCYESMFKNCTAITEFPEMGSITASGTNLSTGCFKNMFYGCSSLVDNMPANIYTDVNSPDYAFYGMFEKCTSLKTAPGMVKNQEDFIDYDTNRAGCYARMYAGCTSLKVAVFPLFGNVENTTSLCESMYEGCLSLEVVPTLAMDEENRYGTAFFRNTFKNCTKLRKAPALPCVLNANCFEGMFDGCSSLLGGPVLPQRVLASSCYRRMFAGCTEMNVAPELPATNLVDECYYEMFDGCTNLRYMDVAFSVWGTGDAPSSTYHWVNNVAPSGIFMAPSGLQKQYDISHIPFGWRAEDNGDYFCLRADANTTIKIFNTIDDNTTDVENFGLKISFDKENWHPYDKSNGVILKNGSNSNNSTTGGIVYFKATKGSLSESADKYFYFSTSGNVTASGNVMSLIDASMQSTTVPDYTFYKLFHGVSGLNAVSDLKLPATTVGAYAYADMFDGCSVLKGNATVTPMLPATTLGAYCYENLFKGWSKLEYAPKLPAKNLVEGCYNGLFQGCASLREMNVSFTKWVDDATTNWVDGVRDKGDFYCLSDLLVDAVKPVEQGGWGSENECANIYGSSKIPKDGIGIPGDPDAHKWVIILDVNIDFDYSTNELTLSGGDNIFYCEDPATVPTTVEQIMVAGGANASYPGAPIDKSEWVNGVTDLAEKKFYAASTFNTSIPTNLCRSIVRDLTIFAYPRYQGYCLATDADKLEKSLFYGEKTSSESHPVFIFVPNGEINLAGKSSNLKVGDYVSLVGQSAINSIIRKDVADAAPISVTGNYAYLQDIRLKNTNASGFAFENRGMYTTLNVGMDGSYIDGNGVEHFSITPEWTTGAQKGMYAPVTRVITNGGAVNIISDAKTFLVELNGLWDITDCKVFYIAGGLNSEYTIRAANAYGGFGPYFNLNDKEKVTPVDHKGLALYDKPLSVKLNSNGFASFYYEEDKVGGKEHRLRAIGGSAFVAKVIGRFGDVVLTHINDKDIIPSGTGVILFGQPGTSIDFYVDLDTDVSAFDKYLDPEYNQLTGVTTAWSPGEADRYYGLSGKAFRRLSSSGTIQANRAFFDCGSEQYAAAVRSVRFADWDVLDFSIDEEEPTGIQNLHYVGNENKFSPTYNLLGQRTSKLKGLIVKNGKVVMVK